MSRKHLPRSVLRQKALANQLKEELQGGPNSLAQDEDGGRGTTENTRLICQAQARGWQVPEQFKPLIIARQIDIIQYSADEKAVAITAKGLVAAELRERQLAIQERELALKQGLVDAVTGQSQPTATDLATGLARLLATEPAVTVLERERTETRSVVAMPMVDDRESGSMAERPAI